MFSFPFFLPYSQTPSLTCQGRVSIATNQQPSFPLFHFCLSSSFLLSFFFSFRFQKEEEEARRENAPTRVVYHLWQVRKQNPMAKANVYTSSGLKQLFRGSCLIPPWNRSHMLRGENYRVRRLVILICLVVYWLTHLSWGPSSHGIWCHVAAWYYFWPSPWFGILSPPLLSRGIKSITRPNFVGNELIFPNRPTAIDHEIKGGKKWQNLENNKKNISKGRAFASENLLWIQESNNSCASRTCGLHCYQPHFQVASPHLQIILARTIQMNEKLVGNFRMHFLTLSFVNVLAPKMPTNQTRFSVHLIPWVDQGLVKTSTESCRHPI